MLGPRAASTSKAISALMANRSLTAYSGATASPVPVTRALLTSLLVTAPVAVTLTLSAPAAVFLNDTSGSIPGSFVVVQPNIIPLSPMPIPPANPSVAEGAAYAALVTTLQE